MLCCVIRVANWAGVWQHVPLEAGKSYQFHARLKVLNQQPGALYHRAEFMVRVDLVEGKTDKILQAEDLD